MNLEVAKLIREQTTIQQNSLSHVRRLSNKHAGMVRGFVILSEAWYAHANREPGQVDSIMIGYYNEEMGGTTGEFEVQWIELAGKSVPRLKVFDDGWNALYEFRDLLQAMSALDNLNVTPQFFCKILIALGIKDLTRREQ